MTQPLNDGLKNSPYAPDYKMRRGDPGLFSLLIKLLQALVVCTLLGLALWGQGLPTQTKTHLLSYIAAAGLVGALIITLSMFRWRYAVALLTVALLIGGTVAALTFVR
jgi:hypothetical protein